MDSFIGFIHLTFVPRVDSPTTRHIATHLASPSRAAMTDAKTSKSVIKAADMPNVRFDRDSRARDDDDDDDDDDVDARPIVPRSLTHPSSPRATRPRARDD